MTRDDFGDLEVMKTKDFPERQRRVPKGPLDEELVEDADSRHEQFTEEADRWHGDK